MKRLFLLLFLSGGLFANCCLPDFCNLKTEADCLVKELGSTPGGQLLVGQLVQAINSELVLLDLLIAGKTGAVIVENMHHQNIVLNNTDPLVVDIYCKIMEVATYNKKLIRQCYSNLCVNPCPARLSCNEHFCFLDRMRFILGCYQQKLREFLCKISCQAECA